MYTFGYIREATKAHLDLDEAEAQAMRLQERYHIFANEAMQAICGIKPKYVYFNCKIVERYEPIVNLGNNEFRKAKPEDLAKGLQLADEKDTIKWYESQNIFLVNQRVKMPIDFLVFAEKQAWVIDSLAPFDPENFVMAIRPRRPQSTNNKVRATNSHFMYTDRNTLTFWKPGEYYIPYKAIWHRFISGIGDEEEIDMPIDILLTIPIYVASLCLQIDHAQRAAAKRAEFETMLARCASTDFLDLKEITPTFQ